MAEGSRDLKSDTSLARRSASVGWGFLDEEVSSAKTRGVVEIERAVCGGGARHGMRVGHWRDCRSNRRGNEAIVVRGLGGY